MTAKWPQAATHTIVAPYMEIYVSVSPYPFYIPDAISISPWACHLLYPYMEQTDLFAPDAMTTHG